MNRNAAALELRQIGEIGLQQSEMIMDDVDIRGYHIMHSQRCIIVRTGQTPRTVGLITHWDGEYTVNWYQPRPA
jgi:hypothetical protein